MWAAPIIDNLVFIMGRFGYNPAQGLILDIG